MDKKDKPRTPSKNQAKSAPRDKAPRASKASAAPSGRSRGQASKGASAAKPPSPKSGTSTSERLNRYVATYTGISRRKVDVLIEQGEVKVNGKVAQLGQVINPSKDKVSLAGQAVELQRTQIILFHKPKGVLTTRHDPEGRKTIYDILPKDYYNLDPAGRLDRNSAGLILMTNDGALIQRLTHPRYEHKKQYRVKVNKPLTEAILEKLTTGVLLMPENKSAVAEVKSVMDPKTVTLVLKTGLNRQIRRMFEALGYDVLDLKRTAFAGIPLGDLAPGATRPLSFRETRSLLSPQTPSGSRQAPSSRGTSAPKPSRSGSGTGRSPASKPSRSGPTSGKGPSRGRPKSSG